MATAYRRDDQKDEPSGRTQGSADLTQSKTRYSFRWQQAALTALPFAGLWWLAAGGGSSWVVGLPCILLAAGLAGQADEVPSPIRPMRLPGFFFWFVVQSVRGGLDVARRALMPSLPIAPGLLTHRSALPPDARTWLANTITLLPGTLTARLDGDRIDVHAIERSAAVDAEIEHAERRITALIAAHAIGTDAREVKP